MHVLRPLQTRDLSSLERFALKATAGITNLPKDSDFLRRRIDSSIEAFSKAQETPDNEYYGFALEENGREVIGTCGIFSRIGVDHPHHIYQIETLIHRAGDIEWKEKLLIPKNYSNGPSEICSLYLLPNKRKGGIGRLLSLPRFLFMADFPERFTDEVYAEMRGVSENCTDCPFWEGIGRHFLDVSFCEALSLLSKDPTCKPHILPKYPIHISLLPQEVQKVIGQPHENTRPAMSMLEKEGFRFNGEVDLLDAGPTIAANLQEVRAVKESVRLPVSEIVDEVPEGDKMVIGNCRIDFRAIFGFVASDGKSATISAESAKALEVEVGDEIRWVKAFPM